MRILILLISASMLFTGKCFFSVGTGLFADTVIVHKHEVVHKKKTTTKSMIIEKIKTYPGKHWMQFKDPGDAGFSVQGLKAAEDLLNQKNPDGAMLIVYQGKVLYSVGDPARRYMIHSMRKSILSALFGVNNSKIDTLATLNQLGISDIDSLTTEERSAKVIDLLSGRSGIYLPSAYSTSDMEKNLPPRGSHKPGTFWFYNNWDFNVLGTVFKKQTGKDLFEAFDSQLAQPLQMEDFRMLDGYYRHEPQRSKHPAYLFKMSSRDLARFGLLFLNHGQWRDKEIVPADWVNAATRPRILDTGNLADKGSFGLLWWISPGVDGHPMFYASGLDGHRLCIFPDDNMIIVLRTNTYQDRSISEDYVSSMLQMILKAKTEEASRNPDLIELAPPSNRTKNQAKPRPEIVGTYNQRAIGNVKVSIVENQAMIETGTGKYRLLPVSATEFVVEDMNIVAAFINDAANKGKVKLFMNEKRDLEKVELYH